jgi:hypothetical protein
MFQVRRVPIIVVLALAPLFSAAGCGPTLSTQVRTETAFAPDNNGTLSKDGLTIEVPNLKQVPDAFRVEAPACDPTGKPVLDTATGAAVTTPVYAVTLGADLYQIKLSNQTDHVIRLQGAVIRLFDPAENPIEPQTKEEIVATASRSSNLVRQGACPDAAAKINEALMTIRFIGPNTEMLPGTTTTGYLSFLPPNAELPGAWKLSLYEIPVKVDAAGAVVAKTRFDFAYLRKKYQDTYSQELMGERKLVSTKEVP